MFRIPVPVLCFNVSSYHLPFVKQINVLCWSIIFFFDVIPLHHQGYLWLQSTFLCGVLFTVYLFGLEEIWLIDSPTIGVCWVPILMAYSIIVLLMWCSCSPWASIFAFWVLFLWSSILLYNYLCPWKCGLLCYTHIVILRLQTY